MTYGVKLEKFEGPLDLLLSLIETEKMAISDISLAQVTEQYLTRVENDETIGPEEMVDFLVVATKLLLLKSKLLLPVVEDEAEDDDLTKQLKIYKEFIEASAVIKDLLASPRGFFVREISPVKIETVFSPPQKVGSEQLRDLFALVLVRLRPLFVLPQSLMAKTVSLQDKISQIKELLKTRERLSFSALLAGATSRTEMIVGFLALLELIKQRQIDAVQEQSFMEIIIKRVE